MVNSTEEGTGDEDGRGFRGDEGWRSHVCFFNLQLMLIGKEFLPKILRVERNLITSFINLSNGQFFRYRSNGYKHIKYQ